MSEEQYDGFYFLPPDEEEVEGVKLSFFRFNSDEFRGKPVGGTKIGDNYHIAFFRSNDEGQPVFDEEFEAIFADPVVYVKSLVGSDIYGCVLRKTENSHKWWDVYLTNTKKECELASRE